MKKKLLTALCAALIFTSASCNDPIFFIISQEVAPIPALIDGSPSNFAVFKRKHKTDNEEELERLFVASGKVLYSYRNGEYENGDKIGWKEEKFSDKIAQVASTNGYLYALTYNDKEKKSVSIKLQRINSGADSWTTVDESPEKRIQNIFAVNDILFASIDISGSAAVHYIEDTSETISLLISEEITGAAFDGENYYICTKGQSTIDKKTGGIFYFSAPGGEVNLVPGTDGIPFAGIISLENGTPATLAAITRDGALYTVKGNAANPEKGVNLGDGRRSTGALAVWRKNSEEDPCLLLAGRQDRLSYTTDSGYTYGYLELEIDSNGIKSGGKFEEPGKKATSTLRENTRFHSTIGKHSVNFIFQPPYDVDPDMPPFASTQLAGVWSRRDRGGIEQWNAEDKDSYLNK